MKKPLSFFILIEYDAFGNYYLDI